MTNKTITIKGFKYNNIFTNISEPDFQIKDGDKFEFDSNRYSQNMLIGISGMYKGKYIKEAKDEHEAKFGKVFVFNFSQYKSSIHKKEIREFIQKYSIKIDV